MGVNLSCFESSNQLLSFETLHLRSITDEELTEFIGNRSSNVMHMPESSKPQVLRVKTDRVPGNMLSAETDCTPKLHPSSPVPRTPYQNPHQTRIFSSNLSDSSINLIQVLSPCASTRQSNYASRCVSPLSFSQLK